MIESKVETAGHVEAKAKLTEREAADKAMAEYAGEIEALALDLFVAGRATAEGAVPMAIEFLEARSLAMGEVWADHDRTLEHATRTNAEYRASKVQ